MEERGVSLEVEVEKEPTTSSEVFYNEEMVTNRDVSVACLSAMQEEFGKEMVACDALAASGVRGLRYLKEVEGLEKVLLNDINPAAVDNIRENVESNGLGEGVDISNGDANLLLTENRRTMDYVDIDPFGSPAPYLDSTARALFREGAAGITATDLAVLYGSYSKNCRRRYASIPLKNSFGHETGLRILIKEVFQAFSRYDFGFRPLMCWYERHYYRVFGEVRESKKRCNRLLENISYLLFCPGCRWRDFGEVVGECPDCGSPLKVAGPLWSGEFADRNFVREVVEFLEGAGYERALDLSSKVMEECEIEIPFYDTHEIGSVVGGEAPPKRSFMESLREEGYRATETHFSGEGIRTDAPVGLIREMAR